MNKIYQKSFSGAKTAGFTLIELLVVVLIIGVLASVALPQYQKAVARSRAAEAVLLLSSICQAEERFYLANAQYTEDLTLLDVQIPPSSNFDYIVAGRDSSGVVYWRVNGFSKKESLWFEFPFHSSTRWCAAQNALAEAICATYGSLDHESNSIKYYKF